MDRLGPGPAMDLLHSVRLKDTLLVRPGRSHGSGSISSSSRAKDTCRVGLPNSVHSHSGTAGSGVAAALDGIDDAVGHMDGGHAIYSDLDTFTEADGDVRSPLALPHCCFCGRHALLVGTPVTDGDLQRLAAEGKLMVVDDGNCQNEHVCALLPA